MSQINVNRIKDSNEGAPDFPSGVNVSGITSTVTLGVTNLNTTNVNVSGVVTATTCLLYTSPSPRDKRQSRMPSSA